VAGSDWPAQERPGASASITAGLVERHRWAVVVGRRARRFVGALLSDGRRGLDDLRIDRGGFDGLGVEAWRRLRFSWCWSAQQEPGLAGCCRLGPYLGGGDRIGDALRCRLGPSPEQHLGP